MDGMEKDGRRSTARAQALLRRSVISTLGGLLAGCGIGFLKQGQFGVDPFQVFAAGVEEISPLSFGATYTVLGVAQLLFAAIFDRLYIGVGTVITFLLQGYVIDGVRSALCRLVPEPGLALRMGFFAVGFLLLCFATAVYFCADQGVSAYDAIALIITNTWKKGSFRVNRILTDLCCVGLGCLLLLISGAGVAGLTRSCGIGTLLLALGMGPVVDRLEGFLLRTRILS